MKTVLGKFWDHLILFIKKDSVQRGIKHWFTTWRELMSKYVLHILHFESAFLTLIFIWHWVKRCIWTRRSRNFKYVVKHCQGLNGSWGPEFVCLCPWCVYSHQLNQQGGKCWSWSNRTTHREQRSPLLAFFHWKETARKKQGEPCQYSYKRQKMFLQAD